MVWAAIAASLLCGLGRAVGLDDYAAAALLVVLVELAREMLRARARRRDGYLGWWT